MTASPDAFFRCVWAQTEKGNVLRVKDGLVGRVLEPDARDAALKSAELIQ
jgi:hypothetical protein